MLAAEDACKNVSTLWLPKLRARAPRVFFFVRIDVRTRSAIYSTFDFKFLTVTYRPETLSFGSSLLHSQTECMPNLDF
jgi:hypothetical protein